MATSARPVAPSKRRGRGRAKKPQRAGPSKVSARGLSFGVPSSGSPGAASFSGRNKLLGALLGRVPRTADVVSVDGLCLRSRVGQILAWLVCFARASRALG